MKGTQRCITISPLFFQGDVKTNFVLKHGHGNIMILFDIISNDNAKQIVIRYYLT